MRLLVIGGTGFIGRLLVPRLLDAGHEVAVVHRPESTAPTPDGVRRIAADRKRLTEYAGPLRAFAADVVIDLIASSGRQAAEAVRVFGGHAGRLVVVSSMDVYRATSVLHGLDGGPLEPVPLTEESRLRDRPQTYPAEAMERMKRVFAWVDDEYDKVAVERAVGGDAALPATILRLPMIHGPGDPLHRFFPLLRRMDDGRPAILMAQRVAAWRGPHGYVENVAAAVALAATAERAVAGRRVYNVGDADHPTELEWAQRLAEVVGWRGELVVRPDEEVPAYLRIPGRLEQHWAVDTSRIRRELGYVEPVGREEGLRRTVAWERAHAPPIDAVQFDYRAEDEVLRRARAS
jgi:nucleoside-diphosphate-sugar epimerase